MKKIFIILSVFLAGSFFYAQSADVITDILQSNFASIGQVCYLSAVQQELISEESSYEDAVKVLYDAGQINKIEDIDYAGRFVTYKDVSYIFSKIWDVKGGLMFRLFADSPRYAFKQFQKDGIFASSADPSAAVSGNDVLTILTKCISQYGDFDLSSVDMDE